MQSKCSKVSIGEVVTPILKWNPRQSQDDKTFTYIDISSVNRERKKIEETIEVSTNKAPSRARQLVKTNDVLVSTVRPNLNAVAYINDSFDGATASTGFTVLRPQSNKIDGRYLYYWVQTPYFIQSMIMQSTGANYPAVTESVIKNSTLPLPPLEEQKRIADILDRADAIRQKRKRAIELTEQLARSTFLDMFGDPGNNPKEWKVKTVKDIAKFVTDGTHHTPIRSQSGILLLSARNIKNGYIDTSENLDFIKNNEYERLSKRYKPKPQDLLISCSGSVGRVTVVRDFELFSIVRSVAVIRPKTELIEPEFLESLFHTAYLRASMKRGAKKSSQANLFQEAIKELPVLLPPLELQKQWKKIKLNIAKIKKYHQQTQTVNDNLFNSLLQRAFKGEL